MNQITIRAAQPGWPWRRKRQYELPSSWAEMPMRLMHICGFLMLLPADVKLVYRLLYLLVPIREVKLMTSGQLRELALTMMWIWEPVGTKQPMPSIEWEGMKLLLPNDELKHITLIEYAFADMAYMMYMKRRAAEDRAGAEEWLNRLLSYLLRPANPDANPDDAATWKGDAREMFNTDLCERRMPAVSRLPLGTKLLVLYHFAACKAAIHQRYKGRIFVEPDPGGMRCTARGK